MLERWIQIKIEARRFYQSQALGLRSFTSIPIPIVDSNTAYEAALDVHPLSTVFLLPLPVLRLLAKIVKVPFSCANDDCETLLLILCIFRFQEHLYLGMHGLPTAELAKLPAGGPRRCCPHG